jgi:hypothetical protein
MRRDKVPASPSGKTGIDTRHRSPRPAVSSGSIRERPHSSLGPAPPETAGRGAPARAHESCEESGKRRRPVYTAHQIYRLHYAPKPGAAE